MDSCSAPVQKADPQGLGSGTTYLRRYSAAAFAFLAQADDDGNRSSKNPPADNNSPGPTTPPPVPEETAITKEDWAKLAVAMKKTSGVIDKEITQEMLTEFGHFRYGKDHKNQWTKREFDLCLAWLRVMYNEKAWVDYHTD